MFVNPCMVIRQSVTTAFGCRTAGLLWLSCRIRQPVVSSALLSSVSSCSSCVCGFYMQAVACSQGKRLSSVQTEGNLLQKSLGLTKVADSLRRCPLLEHAICRACGAENSSTQATMMPPCDEVERHITLIASFDAVVGQPEGAIADRMWTCKCLETFQHGHAAKLRVR